MEKEYFVDFDGVILDSQERFLEVMRDNINYYDWLDYLSSIDWKQFLQECNEIDDSLSVLKKLQNLKRLKGIITSIHSFVEGQQKLIYLREKEILVPIYYVLPFQKKSEILIPNKLMVLVDDKLENCLEWKKAGGTSLLFDPMDKEKEIEKIRSLKQLL